MKTEVRQRWNLQEHDRYGLSITNDWNCYEMKWTQFLLYRHFLFCIIWDFKCSPQVGSAERSVSLVLDQLPDAGVQRFKKQCDHQIHCGPMNYWKQTKFVSFVSFVSFSQIALAIGVLTSSWGVRFCGFVVGGGFCHTGSRWRCRLVCVGVRVRRSKTGLSHRASLKLSFDVCMRRGFQF